MSASSSHVEILRQGFLTLRSKRSKWKPYWTVLAQTPTKTTLCGYPSQMKLKRSEFEVLLSGDFRVSPLEDYASVPEVSAIECCFQVELGNGKPTQFFLAESSSIMDEWVEAIEDSHLNVHTRSERDAMIASQATNVVKNPMLALLASRKSTGRISPSTSDRPKQRSISKSVTSPSVLREAASSPLPMYNKPLAVHDSESDHEYDESQEHSSDELKAKNVIPAVTDVKSDAELPTDSNATLDGLLTDPSDPILAVLDCPPQTSADPEEIFRSSVHRSTQLLPLATQTGESSTSSAKEDQSPSEQPPPHHQRSPTQSKRTRAPKHRRRANPPRAP